MNEYIYPEAEEAFVGSMMRNPYLVAPASSMVSPEQISDPRLRVMYSTVLRIVESGECDMAECGMLPTQVITELRKGGALEKAGGAHEVEWVNSVGWVSVPVGKLAKPVIESWQRRTLSETMASMNTGATAQDVEMLKVKMDDIVRAMPSRGTMTGGEALIQFGDYLKEDVGEKSRIRTHTGIDGLIGDLRKGFVTTLGARASCGKSTFVMNAAHRNAVMGNPVLVLSLEMKPMDLMGRLMCAEAGVDSIALMKNRGKELDDAAWDRLSAAEGKLADLPLFIPEMRRKPTAQDLRNTVENHVREHGIRLVVVDHLRLIGVGGDGIYEQQTKRIGALAAMAAEFDLPFLVAAQINRDGGKSERPALHHLEGSGAIEQDSDTVILLHAPSPDSDQPRDRIDGIVAKARDGITASRTLNWEPKYYRIDHDRWMEMKSRNYQEVKR